MRSDAPSESSLAFAQSLETNSVFETVRHGTIGVIDGRYQYVRTLDDGSGALFALEEADRQSHDRVAEEPAVAAQLRRHIEQRFPSLFGARL